MAPKTQMDKVKVSGFKLETVEIHLHILAERFVYNPALLLLHLSGNIDNNLLLNVDALVLHNLPAHLLLCLHLHLLDHPPAKLHRLWLALFLLLCPGDVPAHLLLHIPTFVFGDNCLDNAWDVAANTPLLLDQLDPGHLLAHFLAVGPEVAWQADALRSRVSRLTGLRWGAMWSRVSWSTLTVWPWVVGLTCARATRDTSTFRSRVVLLTEGTLRPENGRCITNLWRYKCR